MKTKFALLVFGGLMLSSCSKSGKNLTDSGKAPSNYVSKVETQEYVSPATAQVEDMDPTNQMVVSIDNDLASSEFKQVNRLSEPTYSEREQKLIKEVEKKIEKKLEKKAKKKGGLSEKMKIGIVLASAGLILLLLGGFAPVFWILGVIAFIIGVVLILMEILEM